MGIRFNLFGLFVGDLKKMVAFYRDVLGVDIEWDGNGPYAEFKHEGIRFAMFERAHLPQLLGQTPEYPKKLNGSFELSINVGEPANVDTTCAAIAGKGGVVIYNPRNEPWKMRSAMIADPEGNLIEIASDFWT